MEFLVKRTTANDTDFQLLAMQLDHELWVELQEDQATYDQHNKVVNIPTAVVVYSNSQPVACGCFKKFDNNTVEIKRMFVRKEYRGKGISKTILSELEQWAKEDNYAFAVLETSIHFQTARNLYTSNGYEIIPNYEPYTNLPESVCMKKELLPM
jgi:GNAT superfamily N-acetyltransferase